MNRLGIDSVPPRRALLFMRVIWFALIFGQVSFFAVLVLALLPGRAPVQPQLMLVWVNLVMLLTLPPVTFIVRALIFHNARVEGGIPAKAYSTGNIIFWAGCESVSFSGLIFAMVNGSLWPTIIIVAIAVALQVITFPVAGRLYVPG